MKLPLSFTGLQREAFSVPDSSLPSTRSPAAVLVILIKWWGQPDPGFMLGTQIGIFPVGTRGYLAGVGRSLAGPFLQATPPLCLWSRNLSGVIRCQGLGPAPSSRADKSQPSLPPAS